MRAKTILIIGIVIYLTVSGCAKGNSYSFRLHERRVNVIGFNSITKKMITEPTYLKKEVYKIRAYVKDVNISEGTPSVPSTIKIDLIVCGNFFGSVYKEGDRLVFSGAVDAMPVVVNKGAFVDIFFDRNTHNFVDWETKKEKGSSRQGKPGVPGL